MKHTNYVGIKSAEPLNVIIPLVKTMATDNGIAVAVFAVENNNVQFMNAVLSYFSGVDEEKMNEGNQNDEDLIQIGVAIKTLEKTPLFIDDTPDITAETLRERIGLLKREHKVQIAFIDNVRMVKATGGEIAAIADDLDITIVGIEKGTNKG